MQHNAFGSLKERLFRSASETGFGTLTDSAATPPGASGSVARPVANFANTLDGLEARLCHLTFTLVRVRLRHGHAVPVAMAEDSTDASEAGELNAEDSRGIGTIGPQAKAFSMAILPLGASLVSPASYAVRAGSHFVEGAAGAPLTCLVASSCDWCRENSLLFPSRVEKGKEGPAPWISPLSGTTPI